MPIKIKIYLHRAHHIKKIFHEKPRQKKIIFERLWRLV